MFSHPVEPEDRCYLCSDCRHTRLVTDSTQTPPTGSDSCCDDRQPGGAAGGGCIKSMVAKPVVTKGMIHPRKAVVKSKAVVNSADEERVNKNSPEGEGTRSPARLYGPLSTSVTSVKAVTTAVVVTTSVRACQDNSCWVVHSLPASQALADGGISARHDLIDSAQSFDQRCGSQADAAAIREDEAEDLTLPNQLEIFHSSSFLSSFLRFRGPSF